LRTSPVRVQEAAGCWRAKYFEFARVFRDRERGDLHLPNSPCWWYRANAGYDAIMADTIVVIAHAAGDRHRSFALRGEGCDPCPAGY
jgi:lysyl-tRNA synthetase class 2